MNGLSRPYIRNTGHPEAACKLKRACLHKTLFAYWCLGKWDVLGLGLATRNQDGLCCKHTRIKYARCMKNPRRLICWSVHLQVLERNHHKAKKNKMAVASSSEATHARFLANIFLTKSTCLGRNCQRGFNFRYLRGKNGHQPHIEKD